MRAKLTKHNDGYIGTYGTEINAGDWYYNEDYRIIRKAKKVTFATVNYIIYYDDSTVFDYMKNCHKIIFTTPNLELDKVPLIELQEDITEVDELAFEYANGIGGYKEINAFKSGYNKAKELYKYTEEDVKKSIKLAQRTYYTEDFQGNTCFEFQYTNNEIIEKISAPKEPIAVEIETEIIESKLMLANQYFPYGDIKFKTQTINGKQYCIITKIYYE